MSLAIYSRGMVNIAEVLYEAIAFNPKNWNRDSMAKEIAAASDRLFDELEREKIPFTLVGGLAMLSHVAGRNTFDLDLIVSLKEIRRLGAIEIREVNEWFAMTSYSGLRVDVLRPECPVFDLVHRRFSEPRDFAGRTVLTATKEGLILLKLFALPTLYRTFQMEKVGIYETDIGSLIKAGCRNNKELLKLLKPHLEEGEFSELRQVLTVLEKKYTARPTTWGSGNRPSPPE